MKEGIEYGRAHEVRAASMAKTAAIKSKLYSRFGKEFISPQRGCSIRYESSLKRKIIEAKSNQVPADVIKSITTKQRVETE